MGRRASSRGRTESPLCDTRSSKGSKSKLSKSSSHRGGGRGSSSGYRGRSKSRDRSSYEPPDRQTIDDAASDALRSLDVDDDEAYHRSHNTSSNYRHNVGYESRDDERRSGRRSSSRDRRRKYSRGGGGGGRRERERSDRKRRSSRGGGRRDFDEADHYRKFEEGDGSDYEFSRPSHIPTKKQQQQQQQPEKAAPADSDPFGLNLCQGSESFSEAEIIAPSGTPRSRRAHKLSNMSMSTDGGSHLDDATWSEDNYYKASTRQDHSYASIAVTAIQLLVLMLQLAMCGVAPLEVNPMVGPFPDAFSEWGGKNAYLILENHEYWRFVTPAFLHVGVLHLLANAFCLLYSSALFEREWGSWTWLFIFLVSEVGCVGVSSVADPDTIAVGSSGALMGLFAAKLAHVLTYTFFDTHDMSQDEGIHVDQLSSVLCGLTLVSLLSSFTYVDWSGHMGGLASGFFAGMLVFARPIKGCCYSLLWGFFGLAGVAGTAALVAYLLVNETEPDEELADACEYFRHFFPEGYEWGCLW